MIEYIKGKVAEKQISYAAIETSDGVGYAVLISLPTFEKLPDVGQSVKVYIHYHHREDDVKLYGFATTTEREIFRHLITVNTIGPRVAMSIMSGVSVENLIAYVNAGNTAALKKIPGVGQKMAERMVVELRDKLKMYSSASAAALAQSGGTSKSMREEAYAAMLSLGYNDKQVAKAIDAVSLKIGDDEPIENWIKSALQVI